MDTSYEKVCPGCGKANTISEKFCSGCGHQFRTVFQDTAQGGAIAASSPLSDLRSAPVALIAVTVFLILLLFMLLISPNRSAPAPVSSPAASAPAVVTGAAPLLGSAELADRIHSGQTAASVRTTVGEPTRITRTVVGGLNNEDWYYTRGGRTVQVHFNGSQVVEALNTY
ncbi:MAG: hypothetical protein JWQ02_2309 [Capsulimonas sp.]|jgi:hypothetical protein|nr:hypothetical protein [Capsulimonas sp.]